MVYKNDTVPVLDNEWSRDIKATVAGVLLRSNINGSRIVQGVNEPYLVRVMACRFIVCRAPSVFTLERPSHGSLIAHKPIDGFFFRRRRMGFELTDAIH